MTEADPRITELSTEECWRALNHTDLGRLAVRTQEGPDVFPVNYRVYGGAIYFRSAPGSKLVAITSDPRVAFETDGREGTALWSVVVHGRAARLSVDSEIEESGVLELESWCPTEKWNYVRIVPERLTGRRFRRRSRAGHDPSLRPWFTSD